MRHKIVYFRAVSVFFRWGFFPLRLGYRKPVDELFEDQPAESFDLIPVYSNNKQADLANRSEHTYMMKR